MNSIRKNEQGSITGSLIAVIFLTIGLVACVGVMIWLFLQYSEQKNNVDQKVEAAVAKETLRVQEVEAKKYTELNKEPNRQFVGPDDYGRLTFNYPKTWSVYVAADATKGGVYQAYFNPVEVPTVSATQQFALRVVIDDNDYDKAIAKYDTLVKKGDLESSTVSANGQNGTRLDGNFTKDIRGSAVFFKVRDKTVGVYTDADTFKPDFENIVKSISMNL